jgi:tetratricopeptide (TPR) repeat protein
LFEAALDVDPAEREAFLVRECDGDEALLDEVRALLRADAETQPLPLVEATDLGSADFTGKTIAGFRIVRRIGAGGMGVVYEAQQQRPQRTVALKALATLFPSERARRRFEDEAEILARLRHPAIGHVLEAGSVRAGGVDLPWFAMELVEEPRTIERYVREQHLDVRDVVALFATVCDGVHHAHQHGVIHRDLKPANVLVDRHGRVKVIDFGIARWTDRDAVSRYTRTGEVLGTLAYMSPERLESADLGDDTASDVYALGVILFELLAGRLPFPLGGLPPARAMEMLSGGDPPPPSRANPALAIELDWIAMKAMARDPARRYASVAELQRDLARFLRGEPLTAGPPSTTYRLRKLAWRHRVLLGVAAVAFLAVSTGFVIALLGWRRVEGAERLASRKAAVLAEVNRFQEDILEGAYASEKGRELRLADVIDAAAVALEGRQFGDPIVEVGTRHSLAKSYLGLGRLQEAEEQLLRARALLEEHGIDRHEGWGIPISSDLALIYEQLGKLDLAEREMRTVLADDLAVHAPEHDEVATCRSNLANLLMKRAAYAEALELASAARATFAHSRGEHSAAAINALAMTARAMAGLDRVADAQRTYEEARALADRHLHPDDPARLAVLNGYAGFLYGQERFEEHLRIAEAVAETRERFSGPTHPQTLQTWSNLAAGQSGVGRHADAEAVLRRVVSAYDTLGIQDGYDWVVTQQNLTRAIRLQGRVAEAEARARAAREVAARSLPADHWLLGVVTKEQGGCLRELGRLEEAESLLLLAHDLLQRVVGDADFRTQKVVVELVDLYEAWARPHDVEAWRARLAPTKQ